MYNTEDDFIVRNELNLEKMKIWDNNRQSMEPFLLPPSYADPRGGLGFCMALSNGDALTHRRRLHEFTCDPLKSDYYDQHFGDFYSVDQMIDNNFPSIAALLNYAKTRGMTSKLRYHMAWCHPETNRKELKGCPLLRIDDWKCFLPQQGWADEILKEIESYGPLVGQFFCYQDLGRIAKDFIYIPDESLGYCPDGKLNGVLSHAVMVVGIGLAWHKISLRDILYLVVQNNWGTNGNPIGRMPLEKFSSVYSPIIHDQVHWGDYIKQQAIGSLIDRKYTLRMD